jgi:hypothetical protein
MKPARKRRSSHRKTSTFAVIEQLDHRVSALRLHENESGIEGHRSR